MCFYCINRENSLSLRGLLDLFLSLNFKTAMIWHEAEAAKEKRRFIDYYGVDLQLTLYSTNTGMTGFFPPSSKRWNAKEMAEKQLEMIAERFQQSCEMP